MPKGVIASHTHKSKKNLYLLIYGWSLSLHSTACGCGRLVTLAERKCPVPEKWTGYLRAGPLNTRINQSRSCCKTSTYPLSKLTATLKRHCPLQNHQASLKSLPFPIPSLEIKTSLCGSVSTLCYDLVPDKFNLLRWILVWWFLGKHKGSM